MSINWSTTSLEDRVISAIAERAVALKVLPGVDQASIAMDITVCHKNGNPLALSRLLRAADVDFGHDVVGIHYYLDRGTGTLSRYFLPRLSWTSTDEAGGNQRVLDAIFGSESPA